jgi:hypothetical protein
MQEGIQLLELIQKIKALREAELRAERVAFSFMKRRIQPLMARNTLEYQYTGDKDMSRMPGNEVDYDDIVERLGKIFKVLTPKFGKESDLWVRFGKESVWWKEGYFQRYSAKRSAVGYLLRFGKGTVELILRDWTVT